MSIKTLKYVSLLIIDGEGVIYRMNNIIDEKNINNIELLGFESVEDKEIYRNVFNKKYM